MTIDEVLSARRTTRGFLDQPVPQDLIESVFAAAQRSASNCNTQPWHALVVSGEARDQLAEALVAQILSGKKPSPAFTPGDAALSGVYRERQVACAVDYYGTMGVERDDKAGRNALMLKNWQFFGAPHVAFLSMPTSMGPVNAIDVGIYLQSLMLLFTERGVATCPQGALAFFPEPILALGGIPEGNGILCGLSFGYANADDKINSVQMDRAALADSVSFVTSD